MTVNNVHEALEQLDEVRAFLSRMAKGLDALGVGASSNGKGAGPRSRKGRVLPRPEGAKDDELTSNEAAEVLGVSTASLGGYRQHGGGPKFRKVGNRVLYRVKDIEAWMGEE